MARKLCIYDTEFSEKGPNHPIVLISIAMILFTEGQEGAKELYLVNSEFDENEVNPWVANNVLPHLPPIEERLSLEDIKSQVKQFLGLIESDDSTEETDEMIDESNQDDEDQIELLANFADYDHVVFSQHIFGIMANFPRKIKMYTLDLQQFINTFNIPLEVLPKEQQGIEHMALDDTRFNVASLAAAHKHLQETYPEIYETIFGDKFIPDMKDYVIEDVTEEEQGDNDSESDSQESEDSNVGERLSIASFRNSLDQGYIPSYLDLDSN